MTRDHVATNREAWTRLAPTYARYAPRMWQSDEIIWGIWDVSESDVNVMGAVDGLDVVELGCGTAFVSAWLARRGARPVGVDVTHAQLQTARLMQNEYGVHFPLIEADAEAVPLRDESFDLVVSEYGASIWCDPYAWIPEAGRLLRPGGRLVFLRNSTILMLATPPAGPTTDRLVRDYFGLHHIEWDDDGSVEFHLGYGDWIRLLRREGLEVLDLIELQAPPGVRNDFTDQIPSEWAHRWPSEEIWVARKTAG